MNTTTARKVLPFGGAPRAARPPRRGVPRIAARTVATGVAAGGRLRGRPGLIVLGVLLLLALLIPVFRMNILTTADPAFFHIWQADSEALVLAKIESTTPLAPGNDTATMGLLVSKPAQMAPADTFNALASGQRPGSTGYGLYPAQLGLQGFLFTGLYHLGLDTVGLLWTVSALLTALALIAFAAALARVSRPSLGVVLLAVAVASPWLVSAARNLYWVPWTWFLPASVAVWFTTRTGRRRRLVAGAVLFLAFALRWGCGFEFLTCFTLLAMGMPLLGAAFGRTGGGVRRATAETARILAIAVAAFLVVVVVQSFVEGRGDFARGFGDLVFDAAKRTYGGVALHDPALEASVAADPLKVLSLYFFGWLTPIVGVDLGTPMTFALGPGGFWLLVLAAVAVVVARLATADRRWRRDVVVVALSLVVPLSWYVLAKGHSAMHPHIDYVLWYLFGVAGMLWLVGAFAVDGARRSLDRLVARIAPRIHDGAAS